MARKRVKVLLSHRAERDLLEIYRYLSDRSPEALRKVDEEIFWTLRRLGSFPFSGHWVKEFSGKRYREVLVYHYRVIYQFLDNKEIRVLTIRHGRRYLPALLAS